MIQAKDGDLFEQEFIRTKRDIQTLCDFLKDYPAMFYLKWVEKETSNWLALKRLDNFNKCQGKDNDLLQITVNLLIQQAVQVQALSGKTMDSIFHDLENKEFAGVNYGWERIRDRYYHFKKYKPVKFIDRKKTLICGPTKISVPGTQDFIVGFWQMSLKEGQLKRTP